MTVTRPCWLAVGSRVVCERDAHEVFGEPWPCSASEFDQHRNKGFSFVNNHKTLQLPYGAQYMTVTVQTQLPKAAPGRSGAALQSAVDWVQWLCVHAGRASDAFVESGAKHFGSINSDAQQHSDALPALNGSVVMLPTNIAGGTERMQTVPSINSTWDDRTCGLSDAVYTAAGSRAAKFFADYGSPERLGAALAELQAIKMPSDVRVAFQPCTLTDAEKEVLFSGEFTVTGSPPSEEDNSAALAQDSSREPAQWTLSEYAWACYEPALSHPEAVDAGSMSGLLAASYEIDYDAVEAGADSRTTCMIRNIPNKYTQQMLIDMLDTSSQAQYDFVYLRMDFKNRCNVGYAFVNFVEPRSIVAFASAHVGRHWPRFNSDKICHLTYARIQGKAALLDKFRHSRVMAEPASYRPRVFYSDAARRGLDEPFP